MDKNELNSILKGMKIPEIIINQNWVQEKQPDGEESCVYQWYIIERSQGEKGYAYMIEIPSEFRSDDVSLNIHFYTNYYHIIDSVNIFAWAYGCNMSSEKTNLLKRERTQIENIIQQILKLDNKVQTERFLNYGIAPEVINGKGMVKGNGIKRLINENYKCQLIESDTSSKAFEFIIESDTRPDVYLVAYIYADSEYKVFDIGIQSIKNSIGFGFNVDEVIQLQNLLEMILVNDLN